MNLDFEQFKKLNIGLKELDNIRTKSFNRFKNLGIPTKRQEHWKYTDLNKIITNNFDDLQIYEGKEKEEYNKNFLIEEFEHNKIILQNGNFIDSDLSFEDKKRVRVKSLKKILSDKNNFEKIKEYFTDEQNSMISLNHAFVNEGVILEVDQNYFFKKPLIIYNIFSQYSKNKIINNKVIIFLGENSNLTLVDFYRSENNIKYFHNTMHNYNINKNAVLKKFNINNHLNSSYNYNSTKIKSHENSVFENFLLSLGPNFIKNEIHCDLIENYSSCFVNAIMLLKDTQHHELKTNVNHKYENCKSSQLVKSVLLDDSNGTYQGKIYVDKNAQKTNGYQLSKAIILSEKSQFNSKPELEIYADDVKCSHGSTTGNIDENSIFYLMSRGLTKDQASKMIIEGFLNQVIETITEPSIRKLVFNLFSSRINSIKI